MVVRLVAPFLITRRLKKGLEHPTRYVERYGISNQVRPKGELIWLHGASVGESLSILPLIEKMTAQKPNACFLITTTTLAAQKVVNPRIKENTIHQFIPFDASTWVNKFLNHWKPNAIFFVESEIWPNILWQACRRNIPITLLNARLSEASLRNWLWIKKISKKLWGCFSGIYTQSEVFTQRFHQLGADAKTLGNIKLLSAELPFDEQEYHHWKTQIGDRPCWVVASTHQGEEEKIFKVHQTLKKDFPNLLTIIAPRHVARCGDVMGLDPEVTIAKFTSQKIHNEDILLVDAMAKLGVFYRLSPIAFIGGSLIPQGGHNPLEPSMIGAFPLWGPYFFNVSDMMYLFEGLPCQQTDVGHLTNTLKDLLIHPEKVHRLVKELQQRIISSQMQIHQKVDEIVASI
jgi:3-deoxy-D-manno-octulosonic-acid transferase